MSYLIHRSADAARLTGQHIEIVGAAIIVAVLIGVPAGILATRARWLEAPVINITGVLYTIPSLAPNPNTGMRTAKSARLGRV